MAMMICGIAASSAVDTAGESIDIAGLDISSLVGSVVNFEHKSEKSSDYVGRIVKAKKIFGPGDCSNELELKYWNKCQLSFLFCLCSLFNDFQPSAKEVAGIFDYDEANKSPISTLGFSIEGSKLSKEGHIITHSIARKLTLTSSPANKTCLADKINPSDEKPIESADPLAFLFKSVEIEMFKSEEFLLQKADMPQIPKPAGPVVTKPASLALPKAPKPIKAGLKQASTDEGKQIGAADGQAIMSHKKVHAYQNLSAEGHRTAANIHGNAATTANKARDPQMGMHHNQKMQLHNQAAASIERKANRFGNAQKARGQKDEAKKILGETPGALPIVNKTESMDKALSASGSLVSPGQLEGGAALESTGISNKKKKKNPIKTIISDSSMVGAMGSADIGKSEKSNPRQKNVNESIGTPFKGKDLMADQPHRKTAMGTSNMGQKIRNPSDPAVFTAKEVAQKELKRIQAAPKPNLGKSEQFLIRAQESYNSWSKKEEFQNFMAKRLPNLTKAEIDVIGRSLLLKKTVEAEKEFGKLIPMNKTLKFGTPEDQKAVAEAIEERKKNPPKKPEPKIKAPDLKGAVDSEVTHIIPSMGDGKYEGVRLKSGHELHGHPKGKFKVGDKVIAKPHLMGTHVMEHKK